MPRRVNGRAIDSPINLLRRYRRHVVTARISDAAGGWEEVDAVLEGAYRGRVYIEVAGRGIVSIPIRNVVFPRQLQSLALDGILAERKGQKAPSLSEASRGIVCRVRHSPMWIVNPRRNHNP